MRNPSPPMKHPKTPTHLGPRSGEMLPVFFGEPFSWDPGVSWGTECCPFFCSTGHLPCHPNVATQMLPRKCCHLPCFARPRVHPPRPPTPRFRKSCLVGHSNEKPSAERPRAASERGRTPRAQRLPLANNRLREVLLSRPNGELTRAGQFYYGLVGGRPPSRQFDEQQPLIREGSTDFILLRSGLKKPVRSLQPDGNSHQAGQGLLPRQVHGVAGPRPRPHHGHAAARPQRRAGLHARGLPARDRGQRQPLPPVQRPQRLRPTPA